MVLRCLGAALAAGPLSSILGCSSDPVSAGDAGPDALTDAGADVAAADVAAADVAAGAWATGGTAMIRGTFPNPFAGGAGTACALLCETTIGPCHTTSPMRADVSDGLDGIPVRLALRVVDEQCRPVANAVVEIWHTNPRGTYSGNINTLCNTTAADRAAMFFRGYLRTDADGRVDFNTCFPGWYSGRAIHIHVRVMTGDYNAADNAASVVVTQLFFPEDVIQGIFSGVALYASRGQPDTPAATDNVIGGTADRARYTCDVVRTAEGVMFASKTLIVRSSTSLANCATQGSGMMGGARDGGMPSRPDGG
jgi:protocatechuate 3,4-dioxygenase beta subunit